MNEIKEKEVRVMKPQELIHLTKVELVKEIIRLRKKINALIDKQSAENEQHSTDVHNLNNLEIVGKRQEQKLDLDLAFQLVYHVSKELQYPDKWIPFKNDTPNSREYYRMKRHEFMKIVEDMSADKKIIRLLVDIGVIKPSRNGPVTSVSADGRYEPAYILRKSAVDALGVDDE